MSEPKKGFISRSSRGVARYVGRRFGNQFVNEVGRDLVTKGFNRAKETLTPVEMDRDDFRAGLNGRYEDGGKTRFEEVLRETNTNNRQLAALAQHRRRAAYVMFAAAAGFLLFGAVMIVRAGGFNEALYGFVTAFMSFIFLTIGISHDFVRWQIEQRRFGGFLEYFGKSPEAHKTSKK
ncbi:hypothetical protein ACGYLO_18290 [Sulfitobacter sp. 1A13353]|uniref:hypothetical protein n=1 Tax=Sulfitobacter sp. 1A13353 TaxID=3368568 RepID=UPI003745ED53